MSESTQVVWSKDIEKAAAAMLKAGFSVAVTHEALQRRFKFESSYQTIYYHMKKAKLI